MRTVLIIGLAFALATAMSDAALAAKRKALVVGNNAYENVPKLHKAVNDATAVAEKLRALGFEVVLATDVGRRDLSLRLADFTGRVEAGDLALFYYAGHGVEIRGANYVLPTDVPAVREGQESLVTGEAVATEKIVSDLQDKGARAMILVLDACRDNPFKRGGTRSVGGVRGLAMATPPEGVFVLYSAGVGQSALDRISDSDPDPNSVFTRVFLKEIARQDATMVDVAKSIQVAVRDLSRVVSHTQVPAYYDQIIGQLRLGVAETIQPARPVALPLEPKASQPPPVFSPAAQPEPAARVNFTNRAFNEYLRVRTQSARTSDNLAMPNAAITCDKLTSYGPDVPDSRAPRVPLDDIDVKNAVPACIAAVLQDPATPRLRAQLGRALIVSSNKRDQVYGIDILLDLAKDGYPAAMWRLGVAYYNGSVIKKDRRKAAEWFRDAAEKGLPGAMSDLATLYTEGEGVKKDLREAAQWYERAAAGGSARGMRNYALILDQSQGVLRDPVRSAEYLLTAFRMGSFEARRSLFELHESWQADTKAQVQMLLKSYGFHNGRTDGKFDDETFASLNALQAQNTAKPN